MGDWKAAVSGIAGALVGLVIGYVIWGQPTADLHVTLSKVSKELATTKLWLWDEIRTSDERYERVSSTLTTTLADLTHARAEIERLRARAPGEADVDPSALLGPATLRRTGDARRQ
jgi:hypothetical protein